MKTHIELKVSREELYQHIWERPLRDVAAELGISDVGLKKACLRAGIPTPPQGYHLMTEEAAKKRLRVPLPDAAAHQPITLAFRILDKAFASAEKEAMLHAREVTSRKLHPLTPQQKRAVDSTLKELRGLVAHRRTDRREMVVTPRGGYPIRVSQQSFERAFRFF